MSSTRIGDKSSQILYGKEGVASLITRLVERMIQWIKSKYAEKVFSV